METLTFNPLIPTTLWISLAVLLAAMAIWYAVRRPTVIAMWRWVASLAMMVLGAASVMLVLLNPTWVEPLPLPEGKPLLTILVDRSASMATWDAAHASRFEAAARWAAKISVELAETFDVRTLAFDASLSPAGLDELAAQKPEGELTDLNAAIERGLADDRPQGQALVLLSDGVHNASGSVTDLFSAVQTARALAAPVYTCCVGGDEAVRDLSLELRSAQELASVGQTVSIEALVRARGLPDSQVEVVLRGAQGEIARRTVILSDQDPAEVRFDVVSDEVGIFRYEAAVDALPAEATSVNNTAAFVLRVTDEPVRVLLLEGKPYWDCKFLMRTLASDAAIELHSIVRLTKDRMMERTLRRAGSTGQTRVANGPVAAGNGKLLKDESPSASARPVVAIQRDEDWRIVSDPLPTLHADSLQSYQIVVLGRDAECFLSEAVVACLRDWVAREGGSLVCYRGAPTAQINQQLGSLLPVRWSPAREARFRMQLTERGRSLHWLPPTAAAPQGDELASLPTLATAARIDAAKPMTVILASAEEPESGAQAPVISYQPYGAGRVVVVEGSGMWRWAFLAPRYEQHDDVYQELWHGLLRWLVSAAGLQPGQDAALRADRICFSTTENASATLLLREPRLAEGAPCIEPTHDRAD